MVTGKTYVRRTRHPRREKSRQTIDQATTDMKKTPPQLEKQPVHGTRRPKPNVTTGQGTRKETPAHSRGPRNDADQPTDRSRVTIPHEKDIGGANASGPSLGDFQASLYSSTIGLEPDSHHLSRCQCEAARARMLVRQKIRPT